MGEEINATVYVVDDDEAILDSLQLLLKTAGFQACTYDGPEKFLSDYEPTRPGCLILDIQMPGMTGLELQEILADVGSILPIIFITGHADIPIAVQAMKDGAFEFLQKPFNDTVLLDYVTKALSLNERQQKEITATQAVIARIEKLSPREKQVFERVAQGKSGKVIASELNLSPRTIEIYRSHVMLKMQANSAVELANLMNFTR